MPAPFSIASSITSVVLWTNSTDSVEVEAPNDRLKSVAEFRQHHRPRWMRARAQPEAGDLQALAVRLSGKPTLVEEKGRAAIEACAANPQARTALVGVTSLAWIEPRGCCIGSS